MAQGLELDGATVVHMTRPILGEQVNGNRLLFRVVLISLAAMVQLD